MGEGSTPGEGERRNELDEGDAGGERDENEEVEGEIGKGTVNVDGDVNVDELDGEVGSYTGGGTKLALTRRLDVLPEPESKAACRSEAYLSWKVRRMLISIATARKSAAIPGNLGLGGTLIA